MARCGNAVLETRPVSSRASVPGEASPTRREAVKKRTAEYLMRAEQISSHHLKDDMGQGSTQTVVSGAKMSCEMQPLDFQPCEIQNVHACCSKCKFLLLCFSVRI